jgi:hypothetical protein
MNYVSDRRVAWKRQCRSGKPNALPLTLARPLGVGLAPDCLSGTQGAGPLRPDHTTVRHPRMRHLSSLIPPRLSRAAC